MAGNLARWLLDAALANGAGPRTALREGDRAWTYDELATHVAKLSSALRALRLQRGERVLILMKDTIEAATAILASIHAGAVAVPVSELSTPDDVQEYVLHAQAVIAIVDESHERVVDAVRTETPDLREVICVRPVLPGSLAYDAIVEGAVPQPPVAMSENDVCLLLYSAGSGPGELRAVPHCQRTIAAANGSFARELLNLSSADRILSVARLSTAYGLGAGLLLPLAVQAESLLFPAQPHSQLLFEALVSYQPTVLFATPSVYAQLAHDAEAQQIERPLHGLRNAVAGAEGMPERLIPRIRSVLGTEVVVGYGLTEIFQFALAGRSDDPGVRPGVCGKPLAGVQVRLVDEDGDPVGVDEIGTLELQCGSMFTGYWGGSGTGEIDLRPDGWFTTRDRFMVDREGSYHHCGRVDDLFKVGGKWVSPAEVERALVAHEAVWEAAVIGADDEEGLIKPLAFVVTNVGQESGPKLEAELKEYVKAHLSPYKYPRWIEFVDALPRGPGGKLLRYKLRPARRRRRAETGHEKPVK
ncbi:MAG: benzoate-CoA ligase family protein [Deltaproteobacteria bacterium]|nr:benzoate-CoA ligase family protein [Deltaproteobacteria bacterium]MCW5805264.1 benzoate-CoA ligase family protein [Deltaproteobacteria bacterium]